MKTFLIVMMALTSLPSFASIDDILKSLPVAISESHVAAAERIIIQNPKTDLYWDLGMNENHRVAFMREYKKNVELRLGKECLPLANIRFSTPLGNTVDKILKNTQKLCD